MILWLCEMNASSERTALDADFPTDVAFKGSCFTIADVDGRRDRKEAFLFSGCGRQLVIFDGTTTTTSPVGGCAGLTLRSRK